MILSKTGRVISLLLIFILNTLLTPAQISIGGMPSSFISPKITTLSKSSSSSNVYNISNPFTVEQLEYDEATSNDNLPERVGVILAANLSLNEDGEWSKLEDGTDVCQLRIITSGAIATSLYYSSFSIPEGGKLYIYNSDHSHIIGAYTSDTNPSGGAFSTELVAGDDIIIEYETSDNSNVNDLKIYISDISHAYKNVLVTKSTTDLSCMIGINCEEGNDWQSEKNGIFKSITKIGAYSYLCSGTLINNTKNDYEPYLFTAAHCLEDEEDLVTATELLQAQYYFNYETTDCGGYVMADYYSIVGSELLAISLLEGGYDQALLRLTSDIPTSRPAYFNGWDSSSTAATSGVGIHHPMGDVMSISTFTSTVGSATWISSDYNGAAGGHWTVIFSSTVNGHSVVEQGSSGSPLFNQNHMVVGALTGGSSSCAYPSGSNYYGKLNKFWSSISRYLDPDNSGISSISGIAMTNEEYTPTNLAATYQASTNSATLTWTKPVANDNVVGYVIYRNYTKIDESESTSFTEEGLYSGKHIYQVAAKYSNSTESDLSEAVTVERPVVAPPSNLTPSRVAQDEIMITWDKPVSEQIIFWGAGSPYYKGSLTTSTFPIYIGQMWSVDNLSGVDNYYISEISFYQAKSTEYYIYLKQGDRVYQQRVDNVSTATSTTVTLTTPFVVSDSESLICAVKISETSESYLAFDNYAVAENQGSIYTTDGVTWKSIGDNNFYIKFKLVSDTANNSSDTNYEYYLNAGATIASSIPVGITSPTYALSRNGEEIVNYITGSSYTDKQLVEDEYYQYNLSANFNVNSDEAKECESEIFYLSDKNFSADLYSISVNGVDASINSDETYYAILDCSDSDAVISVEASQGATIMINGELAPTTIAATRDGVISIDIVVTSESGDNSNSYTLKLYKFTSESIIYQWSDVLVVVNNPDNNGGLTFSSYQWFINGAKYGSDSQYITIPSDTQSGDTFYVSATTTDGVTLTSCPTEINISVNNIYLYPTSVKYGEELTIETPEGDSYSPRAIISDMQGRSYEINLNSGVNRVSAPSGVGRYVIRVELGNNQYKSFKIDVTKGGV